MDMNSVSTKPNSNYLFLSILVVILLITSSTKVTNNGASTSVSDIQVGDRVAITRDTTNTSQADSILLNPSFGGGPGGGAGGSSNSGSTSTNLPSQTN